MSVTEPFGRLSPSVWEPAVPEARVHYMDGRPVCELSHCHHQIWKLYYLAVTPATPAHTDWHSRCWFQPNECGAASIRLAVHVLKLLSFMTAPAMMDGRRWRSRAASRHPLHTHAIAPRDRFNLL